MVYPSLIYSLIWAVDLHTHLLSVLISCLHFVESFLMISLFFPRWTFAAETFIHIFYSLSFPIYIRLQL